ncbi:MAG: DUF4037 domain-containing protein [Clostridia bacterium]|nr:DUF4037 domain-containing protein [Clostridia bacterium]MBQ7100898.1 DUF4037 domain-containing protein [Clostridia bacterium]
MKGLELARKFYEQHGEPMLGGQFSHILPFIAVGLTGSGSECYGYDDDVSQDHDFEPGFCIFLPDEAVVDRRTAFELERAYSKLPKEFMGFKRSVISPVGGNRHGVIRTADFFEAKIGKRDGVLSPEEWLSLPDYVLAEATNGEIFFDNYGEITRIRESIAHYPEDVRLKKLAGNLLLMGQSGQYNYKRCALRNETAAAQLSVFEFAKATLNTAFLLSEKYMPYYKWSFRALRELSPDYKALASDLEYLLSSGNDETQLKKKCEIIENICTDISQKLKEQGIADAVGADTEWLAYAVNDMIKDNAIRNMHILAAV